MFYYAVLRTRLRRERAQLEAEDSRQVENSPLTAMKRYDMGVANFFFFVFDFEFEIAVEHSYEVVYLDATRRLMLSALNRCELFTKLGVFLIRYTASIIILDMYEQLHNEASFGLK